MDAIDYVILGAPNLFYLMCVPIIYFFMQESVLYFPLLTSFFRNFFVKVFIENEDRPNRNQNAHPDRVGVQLHSLALPKPTFFV